MAKERPQEIREMYRGATRVAPGIYQLEQGGMLLNATEFLEEVGLPDTDENRRLVNQAAEEWCKANGVEAINLGGVD